MRLPFIERKPKKILSISDSNGVFPVKPGINRLLFKKNLEDIVYCIQNGVELAPEYYRRSTGRDHLLEDFGWLHLHVGHDVDDDVLLIVEQTEDSVILIALTDHSIFEELPPAFSVLKHANAVQDKKSTKSPPATKRRYANLTPKRPKS